MKQHDKACEHLAKVWDKEAAEQLSLNEHLKVELQKKIAIYNEAVSEINQCLEAMNLDRQMLPLIQESDLQILPFSLDLNSTAIADDDSINNHHEKDAELILAEI